MGFWGQHFDTRFVRELKAFNASLKDEISSPQPNAEHARRVSFYSLRCVTRHFITQRVAVRKRMWNSSQRFVFLEHSFSVDSSVPKV